MFTGCSVLVLADWLGKGRRFYRGERNEDVSMTGRLLALLPRVWDAVLRVRLKRF